MIHSRKWWVMLSVTLVLCAPAVTGCDPAFHQRLVVDARTIGHDVSSIDVGLASITDIVDRIALEHGFDRERQSEGEDVERVWTRSTRDRSGAYTHMTLAVASDPRHGLVVRMTEFLMTEETPWMREIRLRLTERLEALFGAGNVKLQR